MKKELWGFAALPLLALLAASCIKESVESKDDKPITFRAAVGKQTLSRAGELKIGALQTASSTTPILVRSYKTGDPSASVYKEFNLSYAVATGWSYTPAEFHPVFGLTYYAYYPATGVTYNTATSNGSSASFSYTVPGADDQVDLVAATTTTTAASAEDAKATLEFGHVLSQINFAIQGMEEVKIAITDIEVSGVRNSGTYTFGGTWVTDAAPATPVVYPYTPAVTATTSGLDDEVLYLGNTGDAASAVKNDNENALMLMPQSFSGGDGGFSFSYTLTNMAGTILSQDDIEVDFGDLGVTQWLPGKRYLYKINFETPYYITFTVKVADWEDYDDPDGGIVDVDM